MDANAGHLDRPPTVFPTVAAQVEGHFDLVTGVEVKGIFVLAGVDLPTVAGYYDFPTGTGYLANDLFLMQRNLGYLTWTQPGPENELCASALMHGWTHYLPTNYSALASPDEATPFYSDYRMSHS